MAINKKLTVGPQIVDYHVNNWSRLDWKRVEKMPREYWEIWYEGKYVGDFFQGKSGRWFGCIFGRTTIWGNKEDILNMLAGLICGPQN